MLQLKLPPTNTHKSPVIQPKLNIGKPGDKYEREADAVADRVMRMSNSETMQMQPDEEEEEMMQPKLRLQPEEEEEEPIQMKCEECEREEMVQTKANSNADVATDNITTKLKTSKGNGQTLSPELNQNFSNSFGSDFSSVKIHNNTNSIQMNQQLNARAFTHGSDIYFNQGEYNPAGNSGKRLLAHELTHVVQQNHGKNIVQRDLAIAPPNPDADVSGLLTTEEVSSALHYNLDRFANAPELQTIRDVLGLSPNVTQLIDEDFVQGVAGWQASQNLDIDGKLGRNTIRTLVAEYRAEGRLAPSMNAKADRLAIRTRPNETANNVDVNGHNDIFDAVLSHRNAQISLVMRIDFRFNAGATGVVPTAAQQRTFISQFTRDVRRVWAEMYAMVPDGNQPANYLDTYFTDVRIENTNANPHYVAHIGSTNAAYNQTDPPGPVGQGGPAADPDANWLRLGTADTGLFRGNSRQTDAAGNPRPMRQFTSAHEFGHMVGLPHIHCDTNATNCYGETDRERANVMGLGNSVTSANYTPFIEAMQAVTSSRWKVRT